MTTHQRHWLLAAAVLCLVQISLATTTTTTTTSTPATTPISTIPPPTPTMSSTATPAPTSNSTTYSPCGFLLVTPQTISGYKVSEQSTCNYLYFRDVVTVLIWAALLLISIIQMMGKCSDKCDNSWIVEYRKQLQTMVRQFCCCCFNAPPTENAVSETLLHVYDLVLAVVALFSPEAIIMFYILLVIVCYCCQSPDQPTNPSEKMPLAPMGSRHPVTPSQTRIHFVSKYKPTSMHDANV